jgi:alpha-tubulin suppressor-like RCC1 family protein
LARREKEKEMKALGWNFLATLGAVAIVLTALCSCGLGGNDPENGSSQESASILVYLTDAPASYDNVWVTVDDLSVHKSGGPWSTVPLTSSSSDTNGDGVDDVIANPDGTVTVDLLALRGVETLFASGVIDAGHYTQLRLRVLSAEAVEAGATIPMKVPSGAQTGVKIIGEFTVLPGQIATVLLDFDADESIVPRGGSGKPPILKPVIRTEWTGGTVLTWGWNRDGQLGDGTNNDSDFPVRVIDPTDPSGFLTGVTALAGGDYHATAVIHGGTVRTWGQNHCGQLGDGTHADSNVPVKVTDPTDPSGYLTGVAAPVNGTSNSGAVTDDTTLMGWGARYGSLPVQVVDPTDPSGFLTGVTAAAMGGHAVAVVNDGTLRTWGTNHEGQLGDGTYTDRADPVQVVDPTDPSGFLTGVRAADKGAWFTLAVMQDGTVRTWGANHWGQLGDGTNTGSTVPVRVVDPTDPSGFLTGVRAVAAGTACGLALMDDGTVRAWGANHQGQLGDGTNTGSTVPVQVIDPTDPSGFLTGVTAVAAGDEHSLALMDDGTLRAWGANDHGQLGDGSHLKSNLPLQVEDPTDPSGFLTGVRSVVGGSEHTAVIVR